MRVSAKGIIIWLTMPVVNAMGIKTQTVVSVEATTAPDICLAP